MIHILYYFILFLLFIFDIEIILTSKNLIVLRNLFLTNIVFICRLFRKYLLLFYVFMQQSRLCQRVFAWKLHIYDASGYEIGQNRTVSRYIVLETKLHV